VRIKATIKQKWGLKENPWNSDNKNEEENGDNEKGSENGPRENQKEIEKGD